MATPASSVPRPAKFFVPDLLVHCQTSHAERMVEFVQDLADRLGTPIVKPFIAPPPHGGSSAVVGIRFEGFEGHRLSDPVPADQSASREVAEGAAGAAARPYPTNLEVARDAFATELGADPCVGSALLGMLPCDEVLTDCQEAMDRAAALALRVQTAVSAGAAEEARSARLPALPADKEAADSTESDEEKALADEAAADDGDERPVVVARVQAWPRDVADGVLSVLLEELPSPWKAGLLRRGQRGTAAVDNKRFSRPLERHPSASFSSLRPASSAPARIYSCRHSFRAVVGAAFHPKSGKWFVGACRPSIFAGHFAQNRDACRPAGVLPPVCGAFWKLREALPGGWSQCLVDDAHCPRVLAVDPGALAPALPAGVEHMRCTIQEALPRIAAEHGEGSVDAWVSDMNTRPAEAVLQLLVAAASGVVARGALVVVTLKQVAGTGTFLDEEVPQAIAAAGACCFPDSVRVRRLFANKREATLTGVALGPGAAAASLKEAESVRAYIAGTSWGSMAATKRREAAAGGSERAARRIKAVKAAGDAAAE
ncbi:hypothetical protein FNF27_02529 [Cafeteria roenbergensis]|uniref:Ribosomal RNA methyltransferase FtsJ domain-containing protein n=1 Tax=Cafeteria roenbergensis TaxID=33653 RepID=A0A5A8EK18_CAFRO|nr:hypothetical protein FNF27_02529 [Cafeteria roenbergensis]